MLYRHNFVQFSNAPISFCPILDGSQRDASESFPKFCLSQSCFFAYVFYINHFSFLLFFKTLLTFCLTCVIMSVPRGVRLPLGAVSVVSAFFNPDALTILFYSMILLMLSRSSSSVVHFSISSRSIVPFWFHIFSPICFIFSKSP